MGVFDGNSHLMQHLGLSMNCLDLFCIHMHVYLFVFNMINGGIVGYLIFRQNRMSNEWSEPSNPNLCCGCQSRRTPKSSKMGHSCVGLVEARACPWVFGDAWLDLLRFPRPLLHWLFEEKNKLTFWRQGSWFSYALTWLGKENVLV